MFIAMELFFSLIGLGLIIIIALGILGCIGCAIAFIVENFVQVLCFASWLIGLGALFTEHLFLAVCCIGLGVYTIHYMKKYPNGKPMKDSTLDRIKYVKVHFYERSKDLPYDHLFEIAPNRFSDYYSLYVDDGYYMIDPLIEKQSVIFYDDQQQIIPLDQHVYSWQEIPFNDYDGCAYLYIRRKKAA